MIEGVVRAASSRRGRGRLKILTARVADETGEIKATWFNQPWLEAQLTPGTRVRLRGKPNRYGFQVESYDLGEVTETADYAPVYPASEALAQKQLRALVGEALALARAEGDALPAALAVDERLPLRADALVALHRPRSPEEAEEGRRRLAFDELLVLQLALARRARGAGAARRRGAAAGRRAAPALPRGAPVHAHRRAGAGDRRDRRATSRGRPRCSGCSRATSARARRWSRSRRSSAPSRPAGRER